ncbi:hypothetical protein [Rhodococcus sp. T7]|uniref:hypothetical protein n=1 Tax=Rhodococcus sp. T7 TaxID=627444 RepID=UPI0013CA4EE9|nr:hypothetical protein [Rhodococcus sp. T7]KAF0964872.1 hypothetical protein MLGJGCBP_01983 [Rhodococcus sp. T7]
MHTVIHRWVMVMGQRGVGGAAGDATIVTSAHPPGALDDLGLVRVASSPAESLCLSPPSRLVGRTSVHEGWVSWTG